MGIFKRNIDTSMANSGSQAKPFLYAEEELETRSIGRLIWYRKRDKKVMENVREENNPYFVKTFELVTIKIIGLLFRDRERNWKYDNF